MSFNELNGLERFIIQTRIGVKRDAFGRDPSTDQVVLERKRRVILTRINPGNTASGGINFTLKIRNRFRNF